MDQDIDDVFFLNGGEKSLDLEALSLQPLGCVTPILAIGAMEGALKIKRVEIENFRGIESISFNPDRDTNVIVGPNATGKTTILEAVRLAKSLLAPRYFQESQQILQQLGALAQNFEFLGQQQIDYSAIARDPSKQLRIMIDFNLSTEQLAGINANLQPISLRYLQGQVTRGDAQSAFQMTQFLSSQEGQSALNKASEETKTYFSKISTSGGLKLELLFDQNTKQFRGTDAFAQIAVIFLDQINNAQRTLISYFPADRAFPPGEVNIQIGSADAGNQVQSHLGQPAQKYHRLKQTIVHGIITNQINESWLAQEFQLILDSLIPGKRLAEIKINALGQLKVLIEDASSGKKFDIDSMSSGEKGVILTFLLIRHTLANGGIVLMDEPELHLNPAVCKKIIPFLIEYCVNHHSLQAFICTHSPEVLATAFERDDCNLYHLRSATDLTKVLRRDQGEMFEAMRRLGSSAADVLFSKGNIFVEGDHDVEILSEGFPEILAGYKVSELGGRGEVEKEIDNLQKAESKGDLRKLSLFIFDLDNQASKKSSTKLVRVAQWTRSCLENYLLDETILFDLTQEFASRKPESRGSFGVDLKALAIEQTTAIAVRETYDIMTPDNPGLRPREIADKSIADVAPILVDRLLTIAKQTTSIVRGDWIVRFNQAASTRRDALNAEWQSTWMSRADGKKLLIALYKKHQINLDPLSFKKRIIQRMKADKSEGWQLMDGILRKGLEP